ncbi:hemerythrin domain-containing protein [Sulfuricella sp.]|uniref:hemerythrin domain-containing protein n=1 Tax=Sulfuricella sp. TaxID=2099377 RepID=UPI002C1A9AC4|nr:hemerythrin domain-containing protein [Sulfuricella sp.]HUX62424.1 hemerythrin domain-containing protein [Sulfuricella sp.]
MKRHSALQSLSREHHGALVLALACTRAASSGSNEKIHAACERVARQFETDLEPHFRQEEDALLPLLRNAGQDALVRRTLDDHACLRAMANALCSRDPACLGEFGKTLSDHVRFEEQGLFPIAEQVVPTELLNAALGAD